MSFSSKDTESKTFWSYFKNNFCNCATFFSCILTSNKASYPEQLYYFITILQEESYTIDLLLIQIDKYENLKFKALWETVKGTPPYLKGKHPFAPYSGFT